MTLELGGFGSVEIAKVDGVDVGTNGVLALRPEKIKIAAADASSSGENCFQGVVKELLYLGDITVYVVETSGGAQVKALLANSGAGRIRFFETGDAVSVSWPTAAGHFLHE